MLETLGAVAAAARVAAAMARESARQLHNAAGVTWRRTDGSRALVELWQWDRRWRRRLRKGREARIGDCLVRVPAPSTPGDTAEVIAMLRRTHELLGDYLEHQRLYKLHQTELSGLWFPTVTAEELGDADADVDVDADVPPPWRTVKATEDPS